MAGAADSRKYGREDVSTYGRLDEGLRAELPSTRPYFPTSTRPHVHTSTQLPSGTVTFLFTDVEGSTALWERTGDTFRAVLSQHHALLRNEFRRHGGIEVTEAGDSFLVAFGSALDAAVCAAACQRALAAQDWPVNPSDGAAVTPRVRMAIHTGEVRPEELGDSGIQDRAAQDYRGVVLHRASRILSAAHGGQILCSEATAALIRRDLDPSVRLRDLGLFHLRDVEGTERLFQLDIGDDPLSRVPPGHDFPPPRARPARTARLPVPLTRFVGREKELREIGRLLLDEGVRLVTVTGIGGTGKTRLAVEAARRAVEASAGFAESIWFVPLADLQEPALIPRAIADCMSLPRLVQVDPRTQALEVLREAPSLLILDNFEQVVEGGAEVLQEWLSEVPTLKAMVTSRLLLGLEGEQEFTVAPLATPRSARTGSDETPEQVSAFESVRLFVDRAQAVKPDFQVTNANAPAVAELCIRLEGIPLAIELAAARAQMMTPAQMLEQLARRFDFLVSRKRGTADRQRTLRSAVDWSYRLLPPDLQQFFLRLSVFRGGWTAEATEAVCEEPLALDFLAQLRDSSLVSPEETLNGRMRFRMLESLREYADEKLRALGAVTSGARGAQATRRRHAEWMLHYASERLARVRTPDEVRALRELESEIENVRAAFAWAQEAAAGGGVDEWTNGRPDEDPALSSSTHPFSHSSILPLFARLSVALGSTLHRQACFAEACGPLDAALERSPALVEAAPALCAELLRERAGLHFDLGEWGPAREKAEAALALCNGSVSPLERARAENLLGMICRQEESEGSREAALDHFRRALELFRRVGDARDLAIVTNNLGWVECRGTREAGRGGDEEGRAHLLEALRIRRELGDRRGLAETLTNLGVLAYHRDDRAAAWDFYREALEHEVALRHTFGVGRTLFNLGEVALERGEPEPAARMLAGAERLLREVRSPHAAEAARLFAAAADQTGGEAAKQEELRTTAADVGATHASPLLELVSWALAQPATSGQNRHEGAQRGAAAPDIEAEKEREPWRSPDEPARCPCWRLASPSHQLRIADCGLRNGKAVQLRRGHPSLYCPPLPHNPQSAIRNPQSRRCRRCWTGAGPRPWRTGGTPP